MYIVENYGLAVALCWVTMLCWGSLGEILKSWQRKLAVMNFLLGLCRWYSSASL